MNRINQFFKINPETIFFLFILQQAILHLNSAPVIIQSLAKAGADMIEIGMPFSDPMADGPVIQSSSSQALKNGMSLKLLFRQLKDIRQTVDIPLLLMGYLNPVLQYGMDNFCRDCTATGIDGIILPDLPLQVYQEEYEHIFRSHGLHNIFLISPQTSNERIKQIDEGKQRFYLYGFFILNHRCKG